MRCVRHSLLAVALIGILANAALAQLAVQDTLRECRLSAEALAAAGCSANQATELVEELSGDLAMRVQLEQLQANLSQARAQKLAILAELSAFGEESNTDQLHADLRVAADAELAAAESLAQAVDQVTQGLVAMLAPDQQVVLLLILRTEAGTLPVEYRVLDWSERQLAKLSRALKLETAEPHPLVLEAEATYSVQLASQQLFANRDAVALAISGS